MSVQELSDALIERMNEGNTGRNLRELRSDPRTLYFEGESWVSDDNVWSGRHNIGEEVENAGRSLAKAYTKSRDRNFSRRPLNQAWQEIIDMYALNITGGSLDVGYVERVDW